MAITTKTVEKLFSDVGLKYRVPIYQRHYVWDERNWKHIWDDIKEKTEEESNLLRQAAEPGADADAILADLLPHFTGVIVIRREGKTLEIVDGQQRLTTFQIIFCVIRDLSLKAGDSDTAESADTLIQDRLGDGLNPEDQLKLLPTTGADREAFQELAFGNAAQSSGHIREAYDYFTDAIRDYVARRSESISDLFNAFLDHFQVVQMLLAADDQGAKIFESINGRGIALAQFDHLRNNVFLRAGENRDRLYNRHWRHFNSEEDWLSNTFVDPFFGDFLKAKLGSYFNDQLTLFDSYQRDYRKILQRNLEVYDEENTELVKREFEELQRYSRIYTEIINCDWENPMWFYKFLAADFENTDWHPLILTLKGEKDNLGLSDNDLTLTFEILESYIVRRMLCYGPKQSAPRHKDFVLDLISYIRDQRHFNVGDLVRHLVKHRWPGDEQVRKALSKAGNQRTQFIRYILFKIEHRLTPVYVDAQPDFGIGLTLEHVMPEKWESNEASWSVTSENYHEQARQRDAHLQSIGNLTLLSDDLNYKVGNRGFAEKKSLYNTYTSLRITNDILDCPSWDVPQIRDREARLSNLFCVIWRPAADYLKEITGGVVDPNEIDQTQRVHEGVVKAFNLEKGYGFITPDTDLLDCSEHGVFVHVRDFPEANQIDSWKPPRRVQFSITKDPGYIHIRASKVTCI